MKRVVIIPNPQKDKGLSVTTSLIACLVSLGIEVLIDEKLNISFGIIYTFLP